MPAMSDDYDDENMPQCPACGSLDYLGELRECPHCGGMKCDQCDMGDDVGCVVCDNNEN